MKLEDAQLKLQSVNSDLSFHMAYFFESLGALDRWQLKVTTKQFSQGEYIIKNGRPLWPGSSLVNGDFLLSGNSVIGVITKNSCNVIEHPANNCDESHKSCTVINPGQIIGIHGFARDLAGTTPTFWQIETALNSIGEETGLSIERYQKNVSYISSQDVEILYFSRHWINKLFDNLKRGREKIDHVIPLLQDLCNLNVKPQIHSI